MKFERIGIKVYDLRFDARDEVYEFIDKHYKLMPKNPDGTINVHAHGLADNDIDGELILDLKDLRKYKGPKLIKRKPKLLVITIQETKSGANVQYYDVITKQVFSKEDFLALIKIGKYPGYSFKTVAGNEIPISKRDRFKFNNLG